MLSKYFNQKLIVRLQTNATVVCDLLNVDYAVAVSEYFHVTDKNQVSEKAVRTFSFSYIFVCKNHLQRDKSLTYFSDFVKSGERLKTNV